MPVTINKATIDGANKTFILDQVAPDVNGQVNIDVVVDLFSDAKEVWFSSTELQGLIFPFDQDGGRQLKTGLRNGKYAFFKNDLGWRIRPYEGNHELVLDGNIFGTDENTTIWENTVGSFNVQTRLSTSGESKLLETGTSGLTPQESAAIVSIAADQTVIQGDISTIQSDIGLIQTDIGTINTNIVTIQTDIGAIQSSLSSMASDIALIQGDIELLEINVSNLNKPKKNMPMDNFQFLMVDSGDLSSPKVGLINFTAMRCINDSAWEMMTNTVVEVAAGLYRIDLSAEDTNGDVITYKFSADGAVTRYITVMTAPHTVGSP